MFPSCAVLYKILQQLSSLLRKVRKNRVKFQFSCWKASKSWPENTNQRIKIGLDPDQRHIKVPHTELCELFSWTPHWTGNETTAKKWEPVVCVYYKRRYQMATSRAKVGSPQISSPNRKSAICGLKKFVRFADLPQMWHVAGFAICRPNLFCDLRNENFPKPANTNYFSSQI